MLYTLFHSQVPFYNQNGKPKWLQQILGLALSQAGAPNSNKCKHACVFPMPLKIIKKSLERPQTHGLKM